MDSIPQQLEDTGWKKIPELFGIEEFNLMVKAIDDCKEYPKDFYWRHWVKTRDKAVLALIYFCGLRPKEACSLRWDDINPQNMTLFIRGSLNHAKADRRMPIPQELVKYFNDWISLGKRSEWLFPSYNNTSKPLTAFRWKYIMREKILRPSGLYISPIGKEMPRTRSYSLRASFAVRYLMKSKDPVKTMTMMGHNDFRTLKHYVKIAKLNNLQNIEELRSFM